MLRWLGTAQQNRMPGSDWETALSRKAARPIFAEFKLGPKFGEQRFPLNPRPIHSFHNGTMETGHRLPLPGADWTGTPRGRARNPIDRFALLPGQNEARR